MKQLLLFGLLCLLACQLDAQAAAGTRDSTYAVMSVTAPLLREPSLSAEVITTLPVGTTLWILGNVEGTYLKVRHDDSVGYLYGFFGVESTPDNLDNSQVPSGTAPASGIQGSAPADRASSPAPRIITAPSSHTGDGCPTVQCAGTTQKGPRCRNMTKNCSGRCHYH